MNYKHCVEIETEVSCTKFIRTLLDGGTMSLSCTNENFTTADEQQVITSPATPELNLFTQKSSLPPTEKLRINNKNNSRSSSSNTNSFKTLMTDRPTSNDSWFMGSSIGNNNDDDLGDLFLILGPTVAAVFLFLLICFLIILYLTKRRKVTYNCSSAEVKKKKGVESATLNSVRYKTCSRSICRKNEQILELSYIYTDDDNNGLKTKTNQKETAKKSTNTQVIENGTVESLGGDLLTDDGGHCNNGDCHHHHQGVGDSEIIPLKVEPVYNQHIKQAPSPNNNTQPTPEPTNSNEGDMTPCQLAPEEENAYNESSMAQFLEEFNKKLPLEAAYSIQDLTFHRRSMLPVQNTFQASPTFTRSPIASNRIPGDGQPMPNIMSTSFDPNYPLNNTHCFTPNHTYANTGGQQPNYAINNGSHYAQIDLTSLVKPEKIPQKLPDDYKIIYAELDLKTT